MRHALNAPNALALTDNNLMDSYRTRCAVVERVAIAVSVVVWTSIGI